MISLETVKFRPLIIINNASPASRAPSSGDDSAYRSGLAPETASTTLIRPDYHFRRLVLLRM